MDFSTAAKLFENYSAAGFSDVIHRNDVMYNTGPEHYFKVGESALKAILGGFVSSWAQHPSAVLDMPCGHGRVTRHLRAAFPKSELIVCDIDREGTDFCAETFNARPIYSKPDLLKVELPTELNLIWIGSLFTHLDSGRTTKWLAYLCDHLCPHGLLVATFHGYFSKSLFSNWDHPLGEDWEKILSDFESKGFGYDRFQKGDMGDYGTSASKPSWIMDVACSIPGIRVVCYTERGWANNHDVLVLAKNDRFQPF